MSKTTATSNLPLQAATPDDPGEAQVSTRMCQSATTACAKMGKIQTVTLAIQLSRFWNGFGKIYHSRAPPNQHYTAKWKCQFTSRTHFETIAQNWKKALNIGRRWRRLKVCGDELYLGSGSLPCMPQVGDTICDPGFTSTTWRRSIVDLSGGYGELRGLESFGGDEWLWLL